MNFCLHYWYSFYGVIVIRWVQLSQLNPKFKCERIQVSMNQLLAMTIFCRILKTLVPTKNDEDKRTLRNCMPTHTNIWFYSSFFFIIWEASTYKCLVIFPHFLYARLKEKGAVLWEHVQRATSRAFVCSITSIVFIV